MKFLSKFEPTPLNIAKAVGVAILALIALTFVLSIFSATLRPAFSTFSKSVSSIAGQGGMPMMDGNMMWYSEGGVDSIAIGSAGTMTLSARNVVSSLPPRYGGGTTGNTAEDFEVTDYSASIETRNREKTCAEVAKLKALSYVIFESANESDRNCYYSFKVEHEHVEEILTAIKALNPKDLSENVYTIKSQIDDFTSEADILKKKLASIDETLTSSIRAYNEITSLATNAQNVEALAKIIDSRLQLLERLTEERININNQLDRLERAKADQLDRLLYTYFNVNVYENKYLDFENIKDSWKASIRDFFTTVNRALQDATINLIALILSLVPFIIYLALLLFAAKYGWKVAKYIWQK